MLKSSGYSGYGFAGI